MSFSPFPDGAPVATIPAKDVVAWTRRTGPGRLLLPPIQRSLVWRNSQILNYWDSLLRGYPAGLMMVHRSPCATDHQPAQARDANGQTLQAHSDDFQLFDGQQRLTAMLLGYCEGRLAPKLKIWVDLGIEAEPSSGFTYQLRISSAGQPFGYQKSAPNQKPGLGTRRSKIEAWREAHGTETFDPRKAFKEIRGHELIGAVCPFLLSEAIECITHSGPEAARRDLAVKYPELPNDRLARFVEDLAKALQSPIVFQLIGASIVEDGGEYMRFFGRLGQGGTPLSPDELTYSIIKHQYPEVHDRMVEIMEGSAGRLASEVNLVLGAIRLAKVLSGWRGSSEWEVIGRPNPPFVSRLKNLPEVEAAFRELIPPTPGGRLVALLESIRGRLIYDCERNPGGLPAMLLARLPHSLVDVLLLLAEVPRSATGQDPLPAFTLYWLLFVSDSDKASSHIYRQFLHARPADLESALAAWIDHFERDGFAHAIPLPTQLPALREEVRNGTHRLRSWPERFTSLDADEARPTGNSLRVLSTHREIVKRALLWLQRQQLTESYPHFDPTSEKDEDLPIDLDHQIPDSIFSFDWRERGRRLDFEDSDENFRYLRGTVGNTLGNLRWLDASENRSRGNGPLGETDWDVLIGKVPWSTDDVATFQRLIDERTLDITSLILKEGGIFSLRNGNEGANNDLGAPALTGAS